MPKRNSAPVGAPCWIELFTSDPDKARAFYGELFGWTSEDAGEDYGGYINLSRDGTLVAGCMRNDGQAGTPDVWSTYLATADINATVDAATAHGAQAIVPPMQVMELGSMAVLTDPGQASIGVWQPGQHKGFGILAEPNAPAWFELHTRAYDASLAFYHDVFGWDMHTASDAPEFRYSTFGEDPDALAGIMDASDFLPEGLPAQWWVYFAVDDADKTLAKIGELGGTTIQAAEDTPYGRLAAASDPTGAPFRIVAG